MLKPLLDPDRYKVIKTGSGTAHPLPATPCLCHYEGTSALLTSFQASSKHHFLDFQTSVCGKAIFQYRFLEGMSRVGGQCNFFMQGPHRHVGHNATPSCRVHISAWAMPEEE
jgi:hypothetical protein